MKIENAKYDSNGQLKNGVFKEYFKDESLSCVGEYVNSEKDGELEILFEEWIIKSNWKIFKWQNGRRVEMVS